MRIRIDKHQHRLVEIGKNIRAKRAYAGLSLDELADKTGITSQTIMSIENGKANNPGIIKLYDIADALNCQITDFI